MPANYYPITVELSLPGEASKCYEDLCFREDYRTIGGDPGDLLFYGYDVENGRSILRNPVLVSWMDIPPDEVGDIARAVLMASFESIGLETLYR